METLTASTLPPERFRGRISAPKPCRRCRAPIRYLLTKNNKKAPVDAEPITVTADEADAGIKLLDWMGSNRLHLEGETGYLSHFATCKFADEFRKGKSHTPARLDERSATNLLDRVRYISESLSRFAKHTPSKSEIKLLLDYTKRTVELMEVK